MKPWRENAVPHRDVLEGTFQQSEFAADLTAVQAGKASSEYQDATAFFERTFITEGMRLLLTQVAQRLAGKGGEPVVQLQTAFGGGKTHTMLAVYHLATRECALRQLAGMPAIVEQAGLMDVPAARVAVIDGHARGPAETFKRGKETIATLWGDLAWQLGGPEGYARVKDSDSAGTSPGKEVLASLLTAHAPCVVLMDELVGYVRQFPEGKTLSGGTYDSNISFLQALTEAAKLVPNAIVLASLPESEVEAGSERRGVAALRALEKTFGRVQALWKPVEREEAFEIVRRRLFEPVRDAQVRDVVCRAFADAYTREGARLPSKTQESRYYERMLQAYPIHPEIFDELYEAWSSIDTFQRTRGVLKLMAKVIHRLWKDDNKDLIILPGSLPLYDGSSRAEFVCHLNAGWDPVIDRDIDGDHSEPADLETRDTRFGSLHAARRVARTIFLGSAPSSVQSRPGVRGLDRAQILLGCLQPGQPSSIYSDALNRLADRLHYLNSSGDKSQDSTRFWFDTRANLRREMEDRKRRFDDVTDVRPRLADVLKKVVTGLSSVDGVHIFTSDADIPDDGGLRLVVLPPDKWYAKEDGRYAIEAVAHILKNNGAKPRYRSNRLLFLAPDQPILGRLTDAARTVLAWEGIVNDIKSARLNIDILQQRQAEKELETAQAVLPRTARECYRWLLCPMMDTPTSPVATEAFPLNTTGASLSDELDRICRENEPVISEWAAAHLRTGLRDFYWKAGTTATGAKAFWEDTLRYLYLPRLRNFDTLRRAILAGASFRDYFGTAYGQVEGKYEGFKFGSSHIQVDDTLLLIEPAAAQAYEDALPPPPTAPVPPSPTGNGGFAVVTSPAGGDTPPHTTHPVVTTATKARSFHAAVEVSPATARVRLSELAEELIALLYNDPGASVRITLEVSAEFPDGVSENTHRSVSENARQLGVRNAEWE